MLNNKELKEIKKVIKHNSSALDTLEVKEVVELTHLNNVEIKKGVIELIASAYVLGLMRAKKQ